MLFENEEFFPFQFELCAAILGEQNAIAFPHIQRGALTILQQATAPNGHDRALLGLLFDGIRNDDPTLGYFFFRGSLDDHTVANGTKTKTPLYFVGHNAKL